MRSGRAKKRQLNPDPIYKSRVVARLVAKVMQHGKKATAEGIVYSAMEMLSEDRKLAVDLVEKAVRNVMPKQEVRSRRVGGATYQVPMPVRHDRAEALAIRWIVESVRKRKGKATDKKLFEELKNASENTGDAIRKMEDTHKMAESNRAFAHFRF